MYKKRNFHAYTVQKTALSSSKKQNAIGNDPEASHKNAQNYAVASMQGANKLGFFSPQKPQANKGKIQHKSINYQMLI